MNESDTKVKITNQLLIADKFYNMVDTRLSQLKTIKVRCETPFAVKHYGSGQLEVSININNPLTYKMWIDQQVAGFALSFINGYWTSDHLFQFVEALLAEGFWPTNSSSLTYELFKKLSALWPTDPKKIQDSLIPYIDLSTKFFEILYDKNYSFHSFGFYNYPHASLDEASTVQLQRISEKLDLTPIDHLLDVSLSFGSIAVYAAKYYGVRAVVWTLCDHQTSVVKKLIYRHKVSQLVDIHQGSLESLHQKFTKVAFVPAFDFLGASYFEWIFNQIKRLIEPHLGLIVFQGHFPLQNLSYNNFMTQHFFPYYDPFSLELLLALIQKKLQLNLVHMEQMNDHFARALMDFSNHAYSKKNAFEKHGFLPQFHRCWEIYFALNYSTAKKRKSQAVQLLISSKLYQGRDWLLTHSKEDFVPSPFS